MATTPIRKKIALPAPRTEAAAGEKKRGVRVRGGAPASFRKPDPLKDGQAPTPRKSYPPRDGDARPPRAFDRDSRPPRDGDSRPPRSFDRDSRPPRDGDSRPPRSFDRDSRPPRDGDSRPPRAFDRDSRPPRDGDSRPPRDGDSRPPRSFDRDSRPPRDGDSRPPRSFDRDSRPPRDGDSRPPRTFDRDSRPPREGDSRPPRSFDRDSRPPRDGDSRPPRSFDRDSRPPRDGESRPPRTFDRDARPPRRFELGDDSRPARPFNKDVAARPTRFERDPTTRAPRGDAQTASEGKAGFSLEGTQTFFATCPRGLENVLREELLALGLAGIEMVPGGAMFKGTFIRGIEANLESRVASRVMLQVAIGTYRGEDDIFALAKRVNWHDAFPVEQTIKVQVTAILSPLQSIDFIALKVKDAICDVFREAIGTRPNVETSQPNQRIHVFLNRDQCTLYLDVSGESLFKRGYRREGLAAPIRENLAAGILKLIEWTTDEPLLDPMCGSGTFITEALLMAMNAAPGLRRRNAFERWTDCPNDEWHAMKDAARARIELPEGLRLYARDASPEAIAQTRAHVAALGGTSVVDFAVCDALSLEAPTPEGVMVANPPYGVRLSSDKELAELYPQFATLLKTRFDGWEVNFITADLTMPSGLGLKAMRKTPLRNGALDCRLFTFPIVGRSAPEEAKS
jgi:23S rRNA G2445 N2-methylase RlmL